ncbi:MAG: N-6 DNA methylase [Oscillospiraceae bacterium]|nr:N-6 DNA methylase [Oscillospiraceae bacterium]
MKYSIATEVIPQDQRQKINEKLLYLIDSNAIESSGLSKEDVFHAYTGDGGLHGLKRSSYDNYYEYSEDKKSIENGQFFTPASLCEFLISCLHLSEDDLVADLTCGIGNFFNFFPVEANAYGCELDMKAYKVGRYLYPTANLENKDIRLYRPEVRFDYVVGNPPFNLRWWVEDNTEMPSQLYYCVKAAELLKPFGILALITPRSFLADDFSDGGLIKTMNAHFDFLGQIALPETAFSSMGIDRFPTKMQFWQKRSDTEQKRKSYHTEFYATLPSGFDCAHHAQKVYEDLLMLPKATLTQNKSRIMLELAKHRETSSDFQYLVQKMLYQIKCHPALKSKYTKCCEYLHRFYTEKQPENMQYAEWCKLRITESKVLTYLRRTLKSQNVKPPRDVISFVKRDYDFVYKAYSAKARRQLTDRMKEPKPIYELASMDGCIELSGYERLIRRKQKEYMIQNQQFADMNEDPAIAAWLADFHLWDAENEEEIRLNDIQRRDINFMLQKRYGLLQWEQGSGKTLAGIAIALYRMQTQSIHHAWVVSSAISIKNNWDVVLPNYGLSYVFVEHLKDLERIKPGDLVLVTLNKLGQYRKQIKRWIRMHNQKIQLIFDESDEISNPSSVRTKAVLDCFRRCKAKILMTGTSTRNNISEFAPQLETLYNNSANMLSWSPYSYHYDRYDPDGGLDKKRNPYYGCPIPAYKKGYSLFSESHLPEKITVFGVGQRTQDIYNADALSEILGKTVITRTFEEVSGKDIKRIHQMPVHFSADEKIVYQKAIDEFYIMRSNYFASTGNSRKDAMMRIIQQITLLLRISAAPDTLREYSGETPVKICKAVEMAAGWGEEIVAIGVRHKAVLDSYASAIRTAMPERPLFIVTGSTTTFAKRRALRKTLRESKNGILLCTQQSLPSSVNFEFVNKIIIPELHYNNSRMSQFYMRFIRYTSTEWKDIYFITYAGSIESNQMQMVLAKEKINLFMKGQNTDLDDIYEKFGVDYDLLSLLMYREVDEEGHFRIRWGKQKIS